jgi:integrase
MAKSGMRVGEVTALYRTDIDRKNGFIHIRRTIARDEAGAYIVGDDAKTKSGQRDIPLTDELYGIIKAQEALNNVIFGMEASGLLFRGAEGQILREYSLNREIKRICVAADIEPFTCHAFRNTFATRFIEQRPQDYKILSEILGHKDVSITLNLYTHVMTENKVRAMNDISVKTS